MKGQETLPPAHPDRNPSSKPMCCIYQSLMDALQLTQSHHLFLILQFSCFSQVVQESMMHSLQSVIFPLHTKLSITVKYT